MKTLKQIYLENFESYGAELKENRGEINFKRIQFLTRAKGYTIAIPCSRIKDQETLDDINRRYTVYVHYGKTKSYEHPELDVSKCIPKSKSDNTNTGRCYLSCDNLSLEDATELFTRLIKDNI